MKLLGAIIAGGKSSRFGADKAAASLDGRALIEHVAAGLRSQTDHVIVCGRDWPGLESVADWPRADLGPLGGFCSALRHAAENGFDAVLTAGCDVLPIPALLADRLAPGPAYIAGQRLLGLWPAALTPLLETHLDMSRDRSIRAWIDACGARVVESEQDLFNLNTPGDLTAFLEWRSRSAHR